VAGDDPGRVSGVRVTEERCGAGETAGNEQRLGHRRVADLLFVPCGAGGEEIKPYDGRPPPEAFPDAAHVNGNVEPESKHARRLRALTKREDG